MKKQVTMNNPVMMAEHVKKLVAQPAEWLRDYYSQILERDIDMRSVVLLLKTQLAFFLTILPADYPLVFRFACLVWFIFSVKKCERL